MATATDEDVYGNYTPLPQGSPLVTYPVTAGTELTSGVGNPNTLGIVSSPNSLYFNADGSNTLWTTTNGTTWTQFTGSGGGGGPTLLVGTTNPNGSVSAAQAIYLNTANQTVWMQPATVATNTGWIQTN